MPKTNDPSQSPVTPQFQLGATSSDAEMKNRIAKLPIPGPGGIVERMTKDQLANQQWQLPRAEPDASMSRDHGTPYG